LRGLGPESTSATNSTFDKLLLVEPLVPRNFQAGQVNTLIEAFCTHARNLDEFFQGSGRGDTLTAVTFADSWYKLCPNDKELLGKIRKQVSHLTEQRTSEAREKMAQLIGLNSSIS
jgi:hypothetical protein